MKIDTAGNQIVEIIPNCYCGLTGGCDKCNPDLYEIKNGKVFHSSIDYNAGTIGSEEIYKLRRFTMKKIKYKQYVNL